MKKILLIIFSFFLFQQAFSQRATIQKIQAFTIDSIFYEADTLTIIEGVNTFKTEIKETDPIYSNDSVNIVWFNDLLNASIDANFNSVSISGSNIGINHLRNIGVGTTTTITPANNVNTRITVTGATTVTISSTGLFAGMTGNITVITATEESFTFSWSGGDIYISPFLNPTGDQITTSGLGRDVYSWYYDGTEIFINGTQGYE